MRRIGHHLDDVSPCSRVRPGNGEDYETVGIRTGGKVHHRAADLKRLQCPCHREEIVDRDRDVTRGSFAGILDEGNDGYGFPDPLRLIAENDVFGKHEDVSRHGWRVAYTDGAAALSTWSRTAATATRIATGIAATRIAAARIATATGVATA